MLADSFGVAGVLILEDVKSRWRNQTLSGISSLVGNLELRGQSTAEMQGYLAQKKHPPPQDHRWSLGIGLL